MEFKVELKQAWNEHCACRNPAVDGGSINKLCQTLLDECRRLTDISIIGENCSYWSIGGEEVQCGCCTNGAHLIAEKFHGYVAGYPIAPEDPRIDLIGHYCFGHDFAVVSNFLIDWWAWDYEQAFESPVMTIEAAAASGKYKPQSEWETGSVSDFRIK